MTPINMHNLRIVIDTFLLVGCIYWVWYVYFHKRRKTNNGYKRLVGACFGDKRKAENLIMGEMRSGNAVGRDAAISIAYEKLRRDRSPT